MEIIERLNALREHCHHAYYNDCDACRGDIDGRRIEEHLDAIQAEIEQLLARVPAPDATPAHITLTAS